MDRGRLACEGKHYYPIYPMNHQVIVWSSLSQLYSSILIREPAIGEDLRLAFFGTIQRSVDIIVPRKW